MTVTSFEGHLEGREHETHIASDTSAPGGSRRPRRSDGHPGAFGRLGRGRPPQSAGRPEGRRFTIRCGIACIRRASQTRRSPRWTGMLGCHGVGLVAASRRPRLSALISASVGTGRRLATCSTGSRCRCRKDNPGHLSRQQTADIVALLSANKFPAGQKSSDPRPKR